MTDLAGALRAVVGPDHVLTEPDLVAGYCVDWTGRFRGTTAAVVRPASTAEVVGVLAACAEHRVGVVPQGGNTGLVGGSVPRHGEVVLSLRRLDHVAVDPAAGQVTAGAGATIGAVQAAARAAGWEYGVDWAARDSATIGGSVATNAGGVRVLRHGDTRANLLGVEAVLADGTVISRLGGLVKDNTGYALASLLCGSEGTLGVVTAARLRLVPRYDERVTALAGFASVEAAMAAVGALRRELANLDACELVLAEGMALVGAELGVAPPSAAPVALLVECADRHDATDELGAALDVVDAVDVAVATDATRRGELWRWRELHTEAINRLGPPIKLDVTLPAGALAGFVPDVRTRVAAVAPAATTWLFGHAADGNLHVNVTGWTALEEQPIEGAVLDLVIERGGSISAEHGIGVVKTPWLSRDRGDDVHAMMAIKMALDPRCLLNPGVIWTVTG